MAAGMAWSASPAGAVGESAPTVFSGCETMIFRNGECPTPDYDGIRFYGIDSESVFVTVGDLSYPGDSLVSLGDLNGDDNVKRATVRVELSALPDSAVIVDATLFLLRVVHGVGIGDVPTMDVHRIFRAWDDAVSWERRKGADSLWADAGVLGDYGYWDVFGSGGGIIKSPSNDYRTAWTELPTFAGVPYAAGTDTIYSGYSQVEGFDELDAFMVPDASESGRFHYQNNVAWVRVGLMDLVPRWHYRQWANHGFVLRMDDAAEVGDFTLSFRGCYPDTTGGGDPSPWQPFVVVKYLHCRWP